MADVFHISEAASIALHVMALLARVTTRMQAGELSQLTGFPKSHIAKVMGLLVKAGMLTSDRGPRGGFQLARPAESISLLEVFEAVEGPVDEHSCGTPCPLCKSLGCLTGHMAERFNTEFKIYMMNKRLSDFQNIQTITNS
ncbi:MAG: RrF2 family transcriptional regulator [Bacteroidales bacterium]